jgi:hypothetical protein
MKNCKFCWAVAATLGLILVILVSRFLAGGPVATAPDGRAEIVVTAAERDMVLAEMRGLLEAVHAVIVANNAGDMIAVATAGRKVGRDSMTPHSIEFAAKLPMAFRKLGMDTHQRFDQLALVAEQTGDKQQVSQQLGELTANCVACHGAYRLGMSTTK